MSRALPNRPAFDAARLLDSLRDAGATVSSDGGRLQLSGEAGRDVPPELIAAARKHKTEILRALETYQAAPDEMTPEKSTVEFDRTPNSEPATVREFDAGAAYRAHQAAPDVAPATARRRVPPMPPIEALERDPYFVAAKARIIPRLAKCLTPDENNLLAYKLARLDLGLPIEETGAKLLDNFAVIVREEVNQ